jgi:CheY-like chemotaxis protein
MPKVLIVDDSPVQLYSLRQIVEEGGHEAVTAESGEQALALA